MSEGLVVSALVLAVLLGVGSAAFLVMRSPAFWADAAKQLGKALLPEITKIITKRNSPEIEKAMQDCYRRGGIWDNFKKKCRDR
jgi:hypothetical protein